MGDNFKHILQTKYFLRMLNHLYCTTLSLSNLLFHCCAIRLVLQDIPAMGWKVHRICMVMSDV